MSGTATRMSQAPSLNFATSTTTSTTPVTTAPSALTPARHCQPWTRRRRHRRTSPLWDSVKARNTPIV